MDAKRNVHEIINTIPKENLILLGQNLCLAVAAIYAAVLKILKKIFIMHYRGQ
jgi:hypothetical protein